MSLPLSIGDFNVLEPQRRYLLHPSWSDIYLNLLEESMSLFESITLILLAYIAAGVTSIKIEQWRPK